ncbi:YqaE/Pmp3 family membrane protein [Adhaeribacter aquaticus]|uniref:YqaE/Pmp3 family membrane protein n=1 Tax=Adhaeribacter aquaticus TaxID=299567 RepID=UPI0003F8C7BC|nr:YqaE/Pmp3 family membrane protein [Adhaeribacter aquaticus]
MKSKFLLQVAGVLFVSQFLFSCGTKEYFSFSSSTPTYYTKVKAKPALANDLKTENSEAPETTQANTAITQLNSKTEPILEASAGAAVPVLLEKNIKTFSQVNSAVLANATAEKQHQTVSEANMLNLAKERLATMTKAEKKEFKKDVRRSITESAAKSTNILLVILAILIPPLAVGLYEGITNRFWISLLLTLLLLLPGIIYSLLVVTGSI